MVDEGGDTRLGSVLGINFLANVGVSTLIPE